MFYPGFPGFAQGEERTRMAFGDNYDRLTKLKAKCDPENLLHSISKEANRHELIEVAGPMPDVSGRGRRVSDRRRYCIPTRGQG